MTFITDCNFYVLWTCIGLIIIYLMFVVKRKNSKLPPGPLGFPIIGYHPFLIGKCLHLHLKKLSESYGDVFSLYTLGGPLIVIVNNIDVAKHILLNRADEFIGRPLQNSIFTWIDGGFGIAQTEGKIWREQRRFFSQAVKDFGFGKIEIQETVHDMIERLIQDLKALEGESFEPLPQLAYVSCNVISHILFRETFDNKDTPEFKNMVKSISEMVSFFNDPKVLIFGLYHKFMMKFTKSGAIAEAERTNLMSMIKGIVDDHEKRFDPQNIRDFVDAYLNHMKVLEEKGQLHGSTFSRERLNAIAADMFMEGTDSISAALCSLLTKISELPDIQKKVQEELDNEVGRDRLPSWQDRLKLPYFNAVILELFRTSTPFNISTFYSNFEETEINGFRIPKRSIVMFNFYSLNNDPNLYVEPSKFYPERFLSDSLRKKPKEEGPYSFGLGKRACVGQPLTQIEVFLVIAAVLQNFTLYSAENGNLRAVYRVH